MPSSQRRGKRKSRGADGSPGATAGEASVPKPGGASQADVQASDPGVLNRDTVNLVASI